MNVLVLGAAGMLGPHVVAALAPRHRLRLADLAPPPGARAEGWLALDVTDAAAVEAAAAGMDAIVNLTVVRDDVRRAFAVNTVGSLHVVRAAVAQGVRRVIHTGPHHAVAGPSYHDLDHAIGPDAPPQPGLLPYALTKALGQELCRLTAERHALEVLTLLFWHLRDARDLELGRRPVRPFAVSLQDCAAAIGCALEVPRARLASCCEVFFIAGDQPHGKYDAGKARRVLGWRPADDLSPIWRRPS